MVKEISKTEYQKFWSENYGSPLQSWPWGEIKKETWEVKRLGVFEKNKLVSTVTLFIRDLPLSDILKFFGETSFVYIPRGICVDTCGNCSGIMRELTDYFSTLKIAFVLIDPGIRFDQSEWNTSIKQSLELNGWKTNGATIEPNQTNIITLSKSEDELFSRMKPKWRRNIKKAIRHGVIFREEKTDSAVDNFYSAIRTVSQNTNFKIRDKSYFKKMWKELQKDQLIRIFSAIYKNEVVSSYLLLLNNYAAYEIYGGATKRGRDVEASYLLKWEMMKQMKIEGKRYYDHWGVAPKGEGKHSLSGISYFKSGFGGDYIQLLPQYVKVFNSTVYSIYSLGKRFVS